MSKSSVWKLSHARMERDGKASWSELITCKIVEDAWLKNLGLTESCGLRPIGPRILLILISGEKITIKKLLHWGPDRLSPFGNRCGHILNEKGVLIGREDNIEALEGKFLDGGP